MKALISAHSKDGICELAAAITKTGGEVLSTGGTANHLLKQGIKVTPIEQYTGSAEVLDGRVKTLHPKIYSGLLARQDQLQSLTAQQIDPIDLVVVNLYPFEKMLGTTTEEEQLEYLDIGGVSLIRAAAKNFHRVHVLTNPTQYPEFCTRLKNQTLNTEYRKQLALHAFQATASYDTAIKNWFLGN